MIPNYASMEAHLDDEHKRECAQGVVRLKKLMLMLDHWDSEPDNAVNTYHIKDAVRNEIRMLEAKAK